MINRSFALSGFLTKVVKLEKFFRVGFSIPILTNLKTTPDSDLTLKCATVAMPYLTPQT